MKSYSDLRPQQLAVLARAMPVTIRGVEYPSLRAAAEALRVSRATISRSMVIGTLDTVGLRRKLWGGRPVLWEGVKYKSNADAARALGISEPAMSRRLKRKKERAAERAARLSDLIEGLPRETANWLIGQIPEGATLTDIIRSIITDAYFEDQGQ